jgi:polar amino acid transport system permease protein
MEFDVNLMLRIMPVLLQGMVVTVELGALAVGLAAIWGLVVVAGRLSRHWPLAWLAGGYIQLMRNTPVLVQMYFFYFGLAMAGLRLTGFVAGLLALTLQNGAYIAEIYRAGIRTVGRLQREAGLALGMLPHQAFRIVVFPQAIRLVVPPLTSQFIVILKDTALVSTISVAEMTFQARLLTERTAATYEVFAALALLYLLLTSTLAGGLRLVEWRLRPAR